MYQENDTIVAVSTPPGGAIGVIRISGNRALEVLFTLFLLGSGQIIKNIKPRKIYCGFVHNNNKKIDESIVFFMKSPNSYTGEDLVEIQAHGGAICVRLILKAITDLGIRPAQPGEFTKRAFLNGKKDLIQAEAVMDLITARSKRAHYLAVGQMEGSISKKIKKWRNTLLETLVQIEAELDFPEDDIPTLTASDIEKTLKQVMGEISLELSSYKNSKFIKDGLRVCIVGKPNVGKSSLLNVLLKEDRSIVTEIPGTTRDTIEEWLEIGGYSVNLIDTAGIREASNRVEEIGLERTKKAIEKSDLALFVVDASSMFNNDDRVVKELLLEKLFITVGNKVDMGIKTEEIKGDGIFISCLLEKGIEDLKKMMIEMISSKNIDISGDNLINNQRHINFIEETKTCIQNSLITLEKGLSGEFISIDLKDACDNLGKITGDIVSSDMLEMIFEKFCIGK